MKSYFYSAVIRISNTEKAYSSGVLTVSDPEMLPRDIFKRVISDNAKHYKVDEGKVTIVAFNSL